MIISRLSLIFEDNYSTTISQKMIQRRRFEKESNKLNNLIQLNHHPNDDDDAKILSAKSSPRSCTCCLTCQSSSSKISKSHFTVWSFFHLYDFDLNDPFVQNHLLMTTSQRSSFSSLSLMCQTTSLSDSCLGRFRILVLLFVILLCASSWNPIQANSQNDYWRHRSSFQTSSSSPSSNNQMIKKFRSPQYHHHLHHSNLNYSSESNLRNGSSDRNSKASPRSSNRRVNHKVAYGHHNSPYYNSQLLSIPFPSTHQLLYQYPNFQDYFHHHLSSVSSQTSPSLLGSSSVTGPASLIQSNQIPRSINLVAKTNMIPMKGSKWWDLARHSPAMMEPISLDQAQYMDGHHTNAIIPSSSSTGIHLQSTNQILNTMNLPLRKKQRKLIRDNPGVLAAISKAMKMAIGECQAQFKDRRWNCPVNDWKKGKNVFGKIIQRGCRETAFVYALTSAAVVHTIARACSEGLIETCTCDYRYNRKLSGIDWEWGGCSDNIDFGYKFARKFVDSAERGRDVRFVMNLHNNEAGRLHVSNVMRRECKCHGMSGSCTLQTCWMRLPSFRDIGNNLKDRFDGASRVSVSNEYRGFTRKMMKKVKLKPYQTGYKTPTREDLIYFEESPDFCVPNHKYGVMGTRGRTCNASSIGVEGCHLLCCGRGYVTEEVEEYERCNCTFHWCCQVNCKICKIKKKIYRCT